MKMDSSLDNILKIITNVSMYILAKMLINMPYANM